MERSYSSAQPTRLSESFIWPLQTQYYESLGIEAWLGGSVPSRVTTNSHIARRYARLIAAYARDVDAKQLRIIELGAGHGRFGFLCAKHLRELFQAGHGPRECDWQYVLTDVAERNIQFWEEHEAFESLTRSGLVDFARFQAGCDSALELRSSRETLSEARPSEHVVIIANYFFDSLPIDVWQSDEYQLRACCPAFTLPGSDEPPDTADPGILDHLTVQWDKVPTHGEAYPVAAWNDILNEMHRRVGVGTFTMPICGLETLDLVNSWAERSLLLLSADKGYPSAELYRGRDLPSMSRHGCFSFNVNYAAIEAWFERQGGCSYLPHYQHGYIETGVMVSSRDARPFTQLSFEAESVEQFSPDEFYSVTKRCDESDLSLRTCLGMMKLSGYEPLLLYRLRRSIRARVEGADESELQMLQDVLQRTWENNYHLREFDLAFTVGFIYQRMNRLTAALRFYDESLRLFGENSFTWLNIAGCRYELGRIEEARSAVVRSLELDPDDPDAQLLSSELQASVEPTCEVGDQRGRSLAGSA